MERLCYSSPTLGAPYGQSLEYHDQLVQLEQKYFENKTQLARHIPPGCNEWFENVRFLDEQFRRDRDQLRRQYEERKYNSLRYNDYMNYFYYGDQRRAYELAYDPAAMIGQNIMYNYSYQFTNSKETTKVPTETKKYIIISSAGAAAYPIPHKTLADAEKEATRLAKEFPKQEFTIYTTTKSFKVADKPVDVKVFV